MQPCATSRGQASVCYGPYQLPVEKVNLVQIVIRKACAIC